MRTARVQRYFRDEDIGRGKSGCIASGATKGALVRVSPLRRYARKARTERAGDRRSQIRPPALLRRHKIAAIEDLPSHVGTSAGDVSRAKPVEVPTS